MGICEACKCFCWKTLKGSDMNGLVVVLKTWFVRTVDRRKIQGNPTRGKCRKLGTE
jgi:hypothetical protein